MKSKNIALFIILIFIVAFSVLALPSFHLQLFGKSINFTKIDPSSTFTSNHVGVWHLQRSIGISPLKEYSAELTFPKDKPLNDDDKKSALSYTLKIINERLNYSALYDVKIRGEMENNKYLIKITFPEYYSESDTLFSALINKGDITFLSTGSTGQSISNVDLKDVDIEGPIVSYYENQLTSDQKDVLQFKFKDSKVNVLAQALADSGSQRYFLMLIGGQSFAVFSTNTNITTQVDASPLGITIKDERQLVVYLNISSTYFLEQPLAYDLTASSSTPTFVLSDYNAENVRFIVITFVITLAGLIFGALVVFRREGLFKFSLMMGAFIPLYIFILKIPDAIISIYSITGFIFVYILAAVMMWQLLKTSEDNVNSELNKYRDLSLFVLVILALIFKLFSSSLGYFVDFFEISIVGMIILTLMNILVFRWILNYDFLKK